MDTFICILKSIGTYIALMFVGTNIIGIIIRGIQPQSIEYNEGEWMPVQKPSSTITLVFIILCGGYLFALYYYFNIYLSIAALILMLARIPDLLHELKTGKKLDSKSISKRPIDILLTIVTWLVLPLVWYSLCYI